MTKYTPPQPLNQADELNLPGILRNYRKSLGLNQTDFAKRYGLETPTAVSFWESGFRDIPSRVIADIITANYTPKLPAPADSPEQLNELFGEIARSYDEQTIWQVCAKVKAIIQSTRDQAAQATAAQERAVEQNKSFCGCPMCLHHTEAYAIEQRRLAAQPKEQQPTNETEK